jgi:hypothetical protein
MEDFLIAAIAAIAEMLFEALLEIGSELLLSVLTRRVKRIFYAILRLNPVMAGVGALLLGAGAGAITVAALPHRLVHPVRSPGVHGLSLILSPLLTGFAMSWIGRSIRTRGRKAIQTESFTYGFAFAFAMALVRFILVK